MNLERIETINEVELYGWVMVVTIMNQVDVPFDPGYLVLKAKLEGELL